MSTSTLSLFLRHLALSTEVRRLSAASDRDLLAAYESGHGQAAFTELMRRHGPMVLRTCRRLLDCGPDMEDAFQATFVLLARKAGQLHREAAGHVSLGAWLHHVAYQTAVKVLRGAVRRRDHERQARVMTHPDPDPSVEATWNEIQPILDAELDALPKQARQLLIACYLEGKTYTEAAAELGLPRGSVARHLERARGLLARRLARRGITVSSVLLAVLLEEAAKGAGVPAALLVHTVEAARTFTLNIAGALSENVARLVNGGLAQMTKSWTHWSMALAGWLGLLGAGLIACQSLKAWPDQPSESEPPAAVKRSAQERDKPTRTDCFGDPLPPGALARMGTVRLFNGETNYNPSTLLAFSPDGKILASHIDRMTVALWNAATGKEIRRLTTDTVQGHITSLGFSLNGKTLVTVTWDQKVCLWEVATGKLLRTGGYQEKPGVEHVQPGKVAFLADGRMLAAADIRYKVDKAGKGIWEFHVWDVATGKEVRQLGDSKKVRPFSATAFSLDGKLLATAADQSISLWDVATGKEVCRLSLDAGAAKNLAFSHDGKTLAAADPQTVSLWDVATGKSLRQLKASGHLFGAALAFSPDDKTLVGGQEGHLWEVSTGKEIYSLGLKEAKVALFSPDGKTLALGDEAGVISLWDMPTGKEIFPRPGHRQRIRTVTYSPDGKTLASTDGNWGEPVRLWDVATGKELRQLAKHNRWGSWAIAYSPDGKTLASTEEHAALHLWDTGTGKEIRQFKGNFRSAMFSPDGKRLAAGVDGMVQGVVLWEVATGKEIYTLESKNGLSPDWRCWPLAFSPDGRVLAAPGKDNTVSLWEVAIGKPIRQLGGLKPPGPRGNEASVRFLAFSPDGRVVATSSSWDDKIRLWDVASGKEIGQLDGYKHREEKRPCSSPWHGCVLTFSPDGRMLATAVPERNHNGGKDLAVTLWEVASGKEIGRLAGHRNVIQTITFSPDGKTLASGGDDLTCLIWDVAAAVTGRPKPAAAADPFPPKPPSKEQLEAAWADLASTDPAKAYRAVSVLQAAPGQAVLLLKERVRPVAPVADPEQLARWIADLDDERFAVREKAQRAIERLGEPAIPALRRALAGRPPLEMKRRLQNILAAVEPKLVNDHSPEQLREIRAVQVLESIATPEAQQMLQSLAKGAAGVSLTREAQAALERLARRSASRP